MLCQVVLTFESVDEILQYDHSNKSYWAVLSGSTILYAIQRRYDILCLPWLLLDQFGQVSLEGPAKINRIFFIQAFLVRYWLNNRQPFSLFEAHIVSFTFTTYCCSSIALWTLRSSLTTLTLKHNKNGKRFKGAVSLSCKKVGFILKIGLA